ncbi:MAG: hypothetical protein R6V85_01980 [Polyangia bacterium]
MRARHIIATAALIASVCSLSSACSSCEEQDGETAIRQLISRAASLAERHELGELMRMTTQDVTARPGRMSRAEIKGALLVAFRRYGQFSIEHPRPSVEVEEDGVEASADLPFLVVRENREVPDLKDLYDDPQRWLEEVGELADLYFLDLRLIKEEDAWRVEGVRIRGTRGRGFVTTR